MQIDTSRPLRPRLVLDEEESKRWFDDEDFRVMCVMQAAPLLSKAIAFMNVVAYKKLVVVETHGRVTLAAIEVALGY